MTIKDIMAKILHRTYIKIMRPVDSFEQYVVDWEGYAEDVPADYDSYALNFIFAADEDVIELMLEE